MSYHYLLDLALILLSTKLFGIFTGKFQMPRVVGALLAGLVLGPAMLNILSETEFLSRLSELGVIVILFTAGMGTDLRELKSAGKSGFLVALCGVLVPMAMGAGFGYLAGRVGWLTDNTLLENIFLGTVLTATSVSITVETLKELGCLDTRVGSTILAAALIDDVLGLVALTVVASMAGDGSGLLLVLLKIVLFFVFAFVAAFGGIFIFRWLINHAHQKNLRRYPVFAFVICLLLAYCAEEFFGVADIIGAFVAGLVVACTSKADYIRSKFEPLSYLLLTPVFFAGIGIKVELPQLTGSLVVFSLLLLTVAILSKIIGCGLGAKVCGYNTAECIQVGIGMACRGEVALIVANRGLSMGILSQAMMTPIVITVVGCAVLTPLLLKLAFSGHSRQGSDQSVLADRYHRAEKLEQVSDELLSKKAQ
ncbi:MAG: cation:proton antiporter [Lachnospiraceae bacterium]|jgi:Kef-type K+ transport system membrane component KefB|nr:cation:proton antiporter [Lachnospiraceae bacterium]MCI9096612.1 cation:proton antiporter [Lachnospiraceae bacterium]MCI9204117.1 cation:proton antiporter [Lachnospiraceae bacterium]MCI9335491.1 cation:proton antiporter [Lachnospiraceae bacterium]